MWNVYDACQRLPRHLYGVFNKVWIRVETLCVFESMNTTTELWTFL